LAVNRAFDTDSNYPTKTDRDLKTIKSFVSSNHGQSKKNWVFSKKNIFSLWRIDRIENLT